MRGGTICALCTPKGKGAISLIRVSGPKALFITKKLAGFLPLAPESHRAYFGLLKNKKRALDQALVTYFAEGRSFTGEESLEITCHGGGIYSEILSALLEAGARMAEKGEFSLQALSNGKIDLVQAEGLLQFIESKSRAARRQSFSQLEGRFSEKLKALEKKWLFLLSHVEADIDFALEGLDTLNNKEIQKQLEKLEGELSALLSCYTPFENLQKGLLFGLFGRVNSGKSTLFNELLGEDKAIVSEEKGTTRDPVEGQLLNPEGLNIGLRDSAGFRDIEGEGELKGQKKSRELFSLCDYKIVLVVAKTFEKEGLDEFLFQDPAKSLLVFTKKDLNKKKNLESLKSALKKHRSLKLPPEDQMFFVSALTGEGVFALREKILSFGRLQQEDFFISNHRHYKGLKLMEESLKNGKAVLKNRGEKDILALELREGLSSLYEILGRQIDDKVLDKIFSQFCIGK